MYSALLGDVGGVALVSPGRLAEMTAIAFSGMGEVMGFRIAWAFGYSPDRPGVPSRRGSTFGMVGANGSAAYADIDAPATQNVECRHALRDMQGMVNWR